MPEPISQLYTDGEGVIVQTGSGLIKRLSQSGGEEWTVDPGVELYDQIAVAAGTLVYAGGTQITAIDTSTGAERWTVEREFDTRYRVPSITVADSAVVIGYEADGGMTPDEYLEGFDSTDGSSLWKFRSDYTGMDAVGDSVYFTDNRFIESVGSTNIDSRQEIPNAAVDRITSLTDDERVSYYCGEDRNGDVMLVALDRRRNSVIRNIELPHSWNQPLHVDGVARVGDLAFVHIGNRLLGVDRSGDVVYQPKVGSDHRAGPVQAVGNRAYFRADGHLKSIDPDSGKVLIEMKLAEPYSAATEIDGLLVIGDEAGRVRAFESE
ncbi:PQQ-binding-like beta-propeller repeat protein [Halobaculum litoreum]|nr:PQQ-binding-like beta-propeller repeat protein [Halobaculum sp. DT92]